MVAQLKRAVESRDWLGALLCVDSGRRTELCIQLWNLIPDEDKPDVLADAISGGDFPFGCRTKLISILSELLEDGRRVFDGEAARKGFNDLPERVQIYRGTTEAEGTDYGVCWTLSLEKAEWFATKHGRFRNTGSAPVILSAIVDRDDICGLLLERNESEVLFFLIGKVNVKSKPASGFTN